MAFFIVTAMKTANLTYAKLERRTGVRLPSEAQNFLLFSSF
jgi:hypothetical protein